MLLIGMAFWVLRYVLFAQATPEAHILLYLGVLFHGICYDFFFVTGQLYVDKAAPDDVRSSAQGFIAFVTLGAGMFVGGILNGWWNSKQTIAGYLTMGKHMVFSCRTCRYCTRCVLPDL